MSHPFSRRVALLALFVALPGCGRPIGRQPCRLAGEVKVVRLDDRHATALGVVSTGNGFVTAWSDGRQVTARHFDKDIKMRSEIKEVFSLDQVWDGSSEDRVSIRDLKLVRGPKGKLLLAVLAAGAAGSRGGVWLVALDENLSASAGPLFLGMAGPYAERVDLVQAEAGVHVVWHNGAPGRYRVLCSWVPADKDAVTAEAVEIGDPDAEALAPSVVRVGGATLMSWAEIHVSAEPGKTGSRVLAQVLDPGCRLRSPYNEVAKSALIDVEPSLAAAGQGAVVFFKDDRDADDKAEYFACALSAGARPVGPGKRVDRADGPGFVSGSRLGNAVEAAMVLTYENTLCIGLNRVTFSGDRIGSMLEVYSDTSDFPMVRTAESEGRTVIVYSEEGTPSNILLSTVSCE